MKQRWGRSKQVFDYQLVFGDGLVDLYRIVQKIWETEPKNKKIQKWLNKKWNLNKKKVTLLATCSFKDYL
jgi:hypothetical protein